LATGAAEGAAFAARRCQNLLVSHRRPFMDLGKKSKEKLRCYLNLTGTPQVAVPYVFVELRASGRSSRPPTLVVYEVAGAEYLGSIRLPQSMAARKDKELECDVLYFSISFVLPHGRALTTYKENSTLC
jgi:hypothetical protein